MNDGVNIIGAGQCGTLLLSSRKLRWHPIRNAG